MNLKHGGARPLTWAISLALASLTAACGGPGVTQGGAADTGAAGAQSPRKAVTIKRDSYGVPHVYADTVRGLFHGYGYVVAEDRLFQMEMARRSVLGTAAEVLGAAYADRDRESRKVFDPAAIKLQLSKISQGDRDIFDGYAEGFNARIKEVLADPQRLMPKQFIDAGFQPEPWTGYDVAMIWVGTMANRFSNGSSEIANLQLLNQLKAAKGDVAGKQLFDQIRWLEDPLAPTTVPRAAGYAKVDVAISDAGTANNEGTAKAMAGPGAPAHDKPQASRLAPVSEAVLASPNALVASWKGAASPEDRPVASNLWIVGPRKTTDGSTVFINGPQFGWFNPSYVFAIGLHGAGYDVTGNTPFAHPVVLFGTNGSISWGSTAGPQDVNDIYQEKLNTAGEYLYKGVWRQMGRRLEVIKVKGEADRSVEVLSTVHGLVMAVDVANGTAYSMRRSWDGYEIESLLGWIHSMQAKNWDEWMAQAARVAITINWYYADAKGNIGYVSPARLPIRPANQDVRLPALGDGSMEWLGIKPFSEVPHVYNPPQGFIANWNNQSAPGVLADGGNYSIVDRVNEFIVRLQSKPKLTPQEIWDLNRQTSFADTNARYFVPYIVAATRALPPGDPVYQAAQTLAKWNGLNTNPTDAKVYAEPAATIMRAWLPLMFKRLLADDLPASVLPSFLSAGYPVTSPDGSVRPGNGSKLLYNALLGSKAGVPQTFDFFNGADKNAMIRAALSDTVAELTARYGANTSKWLTPVVAHNFKTVNFMGYPQAGADEALSLPTYMNRGTQNDRVTFSNGNVVMCTSAPPGQSGFIAPNGVKSRHYDDQMSLYKDFGCKSEWLNPRDVEAHLESTLKLNY